MRTEHNHICSPEGNGWVDQPARSVAHVAPKIYSVRPGGLSPEEKREF
jgi:hypothetical protein